MLMHPANCPKNCFPQDCIPNAPMKITILLYHKFPRLSNVRYYKFDIYLTTFQGHMTMDDVFACRKRKAAPDTQKKRMNGKSSRSMRSYIVYDTIATLPIRLLPSQPGQSPPSASEYGSYGCFQTQQSHHCH